MMEATKGVVQKYIIGETKDCFLFYSWFSSNNLIESPMEVGAYLIDMVQTNTKVFCKYAIEKL